MSANLTSLKREIERLKRAVDGPGKGSTDTFADESVPLVEAVNQVHWLARKGSDCFETFESLMRQSVLYRDAPKQTLFQMYEQYKGVPIDGELMPDNNGDENNCDRLPEGFKEGEF